MCEIMFFFDILLLPIVGILLTHVEVTKRVLVQVESFFRFYKWSHYMIEIPWGVSWRFKVHYYIVTLWEFSWGVRRYIERHYRYTHKKNEGQNRNIKILPILPLLYMVYIGCIFVHLIKTINKYICSRLVIWHI